MPTEASLVRIHVKNFKSLEDFELSGMGDFVCLIGLNGAGKSTILQLLDFLRALLRGRVTEWFERHRWHPSDILTVGSSKKLVEFELEIRSGERLQRWKGRFNPQELRCTYEEIADIQQDGTLSQVLRFEDGRLRLNGKEVDLADFRHEGSICSSLKTLELAPDFLLHTKAFGVLDPSSIAQATQSNARVSVPEVETSGKGLVGFIAGLSAEDQSTLFGRLAKFYPAAKDDYHIKKHKFGWQNLLFMERGLAYCDASHLSYGTLRLLVFLSQRYSGARCLLFDEVENGINQELIGPLLEELLDFNGKQIMITTHSALLLNYLPEQTARESVFFLYRDAQGRTRAVRFFDEIEEKLAFLGPGEAMGDTDLVALSKRLAGE